MRTAMMAITTSSSTKVKPQNLRLMFKALEKMIKKQKPKRRGRLAEKKTDKEFGSTRFAGQQIWYPSVTEKTSSDHLERQDRITKKREVKRHHPGGFSRSDCG